MYNYTLVIKNIGKGEVPLTIHDNKGNKRPVQFATRKAAQEAVYIIEKFRSDSAFQYVRIVQIS